MATDFTIVISQPQHFGDESSDLSGVFVGNEERYQFDCPRIDGSQVAIYMFKTINVERDFINRMEINGQALNDEPSRSGLSRTPRVWITNTLLIPPNILREFGNELRIQSRTILGQDSGELDDFVITNVIVLYKTLSSGLFGTLARLLRR